MHRKVPTDENLHACVCVTVSVCILCMSSVESSDHLFLQCLFAMAIWQWLGSKLHCVVDTTSVHTLLSCIPIRCSSQIADMFVAAIVHTLHSIWMACNTLWFSSNKATVHAAKVKIDYLVIMSGTLSNNNCIPSDSLFLDSFLVAPHHQRVKDIIIVCWKPSTSLG